MKLRFARQSGYTFIELMVVMIIVGIIGTLAYPAYTSMARKAYYAEVKKTMGVIAEETHLYFVDQSQYPPEVAAGVQPKGILNWPADAPLDGVYDYDQWNVGSSQCYIQIAFQGDNQQVDYPVNQVNVPPQNFAEFDDDLVLGIALYDC
ncbi:MAG: prepilin-type N-terminal cleavage/methylation domain-containing protein [Cyanobacteria bacterium P01_C01_bin.120]